MRNRTDIKISKDVEQIITARRNMVLTNPSFQSSGLGIDKQSLKSKKSLRKQMKNTRRKKTHCLSGLDCLAPMIEAIQPVDRCPLHFALSFNKELGCNLEGGLLIEGRLVRQPPALEEAGRKPQESDGNDRDRLPAATPWNNGDDYQPAAMVSAGLNSAWTTQATPHSSGTAFAHLAAAAGRSQMSTTFRRR